MKDKPTPPPGIRKWVINGKEYTRWEDLPAEHQELMRDEDQNGIPDSMEIKNVFKRMVKGSGGEDADSPSAVKLGNATYTSGEEAPAPVSMRAILLRIMFAILAGTLIVILYRSFFRTP